MKKKHNSKMLSRNLSKFKLVTFDCTNTLLYFKIPVHQQYLKVAVEVGHKREDFDETKIFPSFKKHFKESKVKFPNFGRRSIGFESWWCDLVQNVLSDAHRDKRKPEEFEKVANNLIKLYETKECWDKYDGCDELIKSLKHHGKLVGIISNFDPRLHHLLRDMNLHNKFDFIITSYEANIEKPDRGIFELALDKSLGQKWNMIYPSESLHIGNEVDTDYDGAINAGWSSVLIANNPQGNKICFKSLRAFYEAINSEKIEL